jgi:hypothetical protein
VTTNLKDVTNINNRIRQAKGQAAAAETPWNHVPHLHLWYHSICLDEGIHCRCRRTHSRPCVGRCQPLSVRLTGNGCFHRGER